MERKRTIHNLSIAIYLLLILLVILLRIKGFDIYIKNTHFNFIHLLTEVFLCIAFISMFSFIYYFYPYEKESRLILSGALIICSAIFNITHVYQYLYGQASSVVLSSISYLLFIISVLIIFTIPSRKIKLKRLPSKTILVALTIVTIFSIFIHVKGSKYVNCFICVILGSVYFNIFLIMLNALTLSLALNAYIHNKKHASLELIHGFLLFNVGFLLRLIRIAPNDIYCLVYHIINVFAIFLIADSFFKTIVKIPYQKLEQSKKELEEVSEIKTDFLINMSHELRTPLNIILSGVKLIEVCGYQEKYIKSIKNNAYRINKLCENIIEFNEIENHTLSLNFSWTDTVAIIDEILEEADNIASEKNIDIQFNFDFKKVIITDSQKLMVILLNLISNAIKYVKKRGCVRIVLIHGKNLTIRVLHTGPGIPEDEAKRIFNKFYKVKNSDIECTEGLGVGLYISKKYAELLGGSLEITDDSGLFGYELVLPVQYVVGEPSLELGEESFTGFFTDIS